MRAFIFLAALLCSLSSFAAARCDARVPETVELGDVRLAYQSIGRDSDPALLLVMGLGGQLIHWPDEVVSALCEQGFRVIRYDNRDVGLSAWNVPVPSSRLTYEVVRYRLGLPVSAPIPSPTWPAMPCICSMRWISPGPCARRQHGRDDRPAHRRHGAAAPAQPDPGDDQLRRRRPAGTQRVAAAPAGAARAASREQAVEQQADLLAALGSPEVRDDRQQLLLQAARSYDRAFNPEGVQRQLLAILAEPSRVPLLNRLQVPTLVIHGTADPLLPVMHGVHVAAHIRGSELKLIPGLAHRFQEAFKEPLLAAVVPYLKAHRQASVVQL